MTPSWTSVAREVRSVTAASVKLTLRRARRDATLLAAWGLLVAFVAMLAVTVPQLVTDTMDRGARQAVATAGSRADPVFRIPVGSAPRGGQPLAPADVADLAASIARRLPTVIKRVSAGTTTTVIGPATNIATVGGVETAANIPLQVGMLTAENRSGVKVVSGELPGAFTPGGAIPVAISAPNARALRVTIGSIVGVAVNPGFGNAHQGDPILLRVVGIIAQAPGSATDWLDSTGLWAPSYPASLKNPSQSAVTVLTAMPGVTAAGSRYTGSFTAEIRVRLAPSRFSADVEPKVAAAIKGLQTSPTRLTAGVGGDAAVSSNFTEALAAYPAQSRAAVAQMSVVLASLLGAAVAVLILLSQLVARRRGGDLTLERARGTALTAIAFRSTLESVVVAAAACGLGVLAARFVRPGPLGDPELLAFALVVAVVAAPVQSVLLARREWSSRRAPANRRDRQDLERRSRSRRLVAEAIVFALALAALVSLAVRGLLETGSRGIDPLLSSAPVLCAVATTLLVLRLYRVPVRAVASGLRRRRGVVGLLGAARAENAVAVIPLLALTLASTLVIAGGVIIATVNDGQVTASWQRIGGDVRVEGRVSDAARAGLANRPGVSAVASVHSTPLVPARLSGRSEYPTLVAIDQAFPAFASQLPASAMGSTDVASLRTLATGAPPTAALPVVVDAQFGKLLGTRDFTIDYGKVSIRLHVVGVTSVEPRGFLPGPFLYVDRAALARKLAEPTGGGTLSAGRVASLTAPNQTLILGPAALGAARSLGVDSPAIHDRGSWLDSRRHLALVTGTQQTMLLATIAVALLAAIALLATSLAGARERGRSLSLLRTLGLPAGLGWWLALADLLPVVVAAIAGGILAGVGIVALLEPALGLAVLAGGVSNPATVAPPLLFVGIAVATLVLLGASVLAEVAAHRRDRLSEVLRVGGTA